jgi:hypothetical protein
MRCLACNKVLNDYESTRKSATTGEYLDLCNSCFHAVDHDIQAIERADLIDEESFEDEFELDDLQGDLFDGISE